MTASEKVAYLSQPGVLARRIAFHTERLCRLRREADAVTSRWGENVASHSGDAPYIRMLEKIEECEEELREENALMVRLQAEIEATVARLPQEKMRLVLLYRYLEGMTYPQIGDLLYMDRTTAQRWKERAVDSLELPENPVRIS